MICGILILIMKNNIDKVLGKPIVGSFAASLEMLNETFTPLSYRQRLEELYSYYKPEEVLVTSSFGTNSAFLLWLISQIEPKQKIYFIDTRYHFAETLAYKKELTELLNLEVIDIVPDALQHQHSKEKQLWKTDTERCCLTNKLGPLEPIKKEHKVWISGVMGHQTAHRKHLRVWEPNHPLIKFHPIIDIPEGEFMYQVGYHKLPAHPLAASGYSSVGCTHCTLQGTGRSGRWQGTEKTECGLHLPGMKQ